MNGDVQDMYPPGLDLHHEQDVQAPEEHRVYMQKVAGQNRERLGGQELPPGRGRTAWRGREPGRGQDPPNRSRADAMPESEEFALDAPVPPAGVLPGELPDQFADLIRDRRAPGGVRVGPLVLDQTPVPGEQGPRCHDPVQPKVPGQQPCQSSDHGPVGPVRFRAGDLTAQDCDLVPQYQDLHVFGDAAAREQRQPAEQPDHEQINQADEHGCRG